MLDFGLAKLTLRDAPGVDSPGASSAQTAFPRFDTSPGVTLGTIGSMSPEQARAEELDARTHLFSFGAVLHEMATGQMAFPGSAPGVVLTAILARPARPRGGIGQPYLSLVSTGQELGPATQRS
jgi:serine/threonine protein kinase